MPSPAVGPSGSLLRRIVSGGVWVAGGKGLAVLFTLIAQAVLARLLPPEEVGAYFLMLSAVSIAAMLSHGGLNVAVVRFAADALARGSSGSAARAIRATLLWGAGGAAAVACAFALAPGRQLALRLFDSPVMASAMAAGSLWTFFFALQSLAAESFRGLHDIRLATVTGGVVSGLLTVVGLALLAFGLGRASLETVVLISGVAVGLAAIGSTMVLLRRLRTFGDGGSLSVATLIRASAPLWASSLMLLGIAQADLWIVGAFTSSGEVALYGAAWRIVSVVSMPLLIVNGVLPPIIADLYSRGEKERLEHVLQKTAVIAGLPATALLGVLAVYGSDVLRLVYGDYYTAGAGIVALLSVGQIVNVLSGSCGLALMMTGHHDTMMIVTATSAAVMAGLAIALVGPWGAMGVAMAAASGLVLQNLLMWLAARHKTGLRTHATLAVLRNMVSPGRP